VKAISVRQPWAFAICYFGKRVENRGWDLRGGNVAQARRLVGSDILIHAAKGCTRDEWEEACFFMSGFAHPHTGPKGETLQTIPRGAIVARAQLVDVVQNGRTGHRWAAGSNRCALCGQTDQTMIVDCPKADPWAVPGAMGLILDDVRPLATPVPFKGALGFFEVPDSLIAEST